MSVRTERMLLGLLLLIFTCFTWTCMTRFYSGDDLMNLYRIWDLNPWTVWKAQLMLWIPVYRPLGGLIYRIIYSAFGFNPTPMYIFCWLLMAGNAVVGYRFFRTILPTAAEALIALSLTVVHGCMRELWLNAGTVYDQLEYLFTALGMTAYIRLRRERPDIPLSRALLVLLLCLLAMDSKESGIALPVLIAVYECIFILPEVFERKQIRAWLGSIAPLYAALAALSIVFLVRVNRTPELAENTAYQPHPALGTWLTHMAEYFGMLTYGHVAFSPQTAAALLVLMALAAIAARNRIMIFGWLFFVITITPVALIISRPGYVLYVPDLGLGLYLATAIAGATRFCLTRAGHAPLIPRAELAAFAILTIAMTWFNIRNWPEPIDRRNDSYRLSEQFRREYPQIPRKSRFLFVKDDFPKDGWNLLFNLRLMYHDNSIAVHRMEAFPDQRPDPKHLNDHDYVFSVESGRYFELDKRDVAESIRLNILRDFAVGRQMAIARRDYPAYVISGLVVGDPKDPGRWTEPKIRLKFDVYPAPAIFSIKFWAPDFVTKSGVRTLTVLVNGIEIGALRLSHDGMNEIGFPVPANAISPTGYTIVEMNVDNPYKDPGGQLLGVILMNAGFDYLPRRDPDIPFRGAGRKGADDAPTVPPAKPANAAHAPGP